MFKVVISLTILERKFDFEKKMRKMTKKSISLAKISHFNKIEKNSQKKNISKLKKM